ncbi:MAG TPA: hypothetical protein VL899_13230 [Alphaproteobacteria bacterium]|nr:hypothetical protein [Alphaproteobacteria bacterium]
MDATSEPQGEDAASADRVAARSRDERLTQAGRRNIRADVLAYAAVAGLISLIWALLIHPIADGPARDMLLILSGALVAIVKDVYGFEFGSSRGSEAKTEQLGRLMGGVGPKQPQQ